MVFNMDEIKNDIRRLKYRLYKHMDEDDFVSPEMLDEALRVIKKQNEYISELEKIIKNK